MNSYGILPHTADIRLKVRGETIKDLFKQAVLGMAHILLPKAKECEFKVQNEKCKVKKIFIKAPESTILLIDFLSEVLTASYEEKAVFCNVEFSKITEREVEAKIFGKKADCFDEDIKGVTYHEAKIIKNLQGELETIIVFDI